MDDWERYPPPRRTPGRGISLPKSFRQQDDGEENRQNRSDGHDGDDAALWTGLSIHLAGLKQDLQKAKHVYLLAGRRVDMKGSSETGFVNGLK